MQPFRTSAIFRSACWHGVTAELSDEGDRITINAPMRLLTLSNAVYNGGMSAADTIVNWKVPLDYNGDDPQGEIALQLRHWGLEPARSAVLMTAAKLTHASAAELSGNRFKLICITTSGTRNAARAGSDRTVYPAWRAGTINTVLLFDGQLTDSAMVNVLMTATEAKAAALQDIGLRDMDNGLVATGTSTDAVVLGVSGSSDYGVIHEYAGTATEVGAAVGKLVYDTVHESVMTQHED
ncbi:adenosylcobinamide amidohydrolase [Paenibacillus cellulosilyticus]|uniref:Adenosylcobinamide amidohydrolase n=1 Tax=Paenibacillus cellulosilyticus TaxID=375489 RepID=A0A2V2Z0E4_9BACL|nr:adenosylcobinamide amidohydrolase [Paenibacillus cellulosilyticus]PWW06505.1 adenosylcobinamide amidohydrolase [Paenibacillus cellulosilyticus]QKS46156.1 adenosylcobinamide amidohydrolase [Paenibacillus cellulosilyticus]